MAKNNEDKGKIILFVLAIICIVILIIGFLLIAFLDVTSKASDKKLSTTTRRTVAVESDIKYEDTTTTTTTTEVTTEVVPTEVITTESTTTTTNVVAVTTQKRTAVATKPVVNVKEEQTSNNNVNINNMPRENRTVINSSNVSTYPGSMDSTEWEIINLINETRKKNGIKELKVASELREKAHSASDEYCESQQDSSVGSFLKGYSNVRIKSFNRGSSLDFYNSIKSTKVTTEGELEYIGVSVINKTCDSAPAPGYYFVMIYE